jgi:phosphoglycolate phosphatase-like HAD superfamily hydrolase
MPPVVLWDIDGTLIRTRGGRVSMAAFLRALQLTCDLTQNLPYPTDAGGKTDEQIALEVLRDAALPDDTAIASLPAFREAYIAELTRDREQLLGDLHVLPGVRAVLEQLYQQGVTQSLLTGNLESIARLKLACVGLDQYLDFDLGAYGSDHRDRTQLVPITRERLQSRLGYAVPSQDVVVVGDTPRDIACARAGGARAIAVATGNVAREELAAHAPDGLLDDLSDVEVTVNLLLGAPAALH